MAKSIKVLIVEDSEDDALLISLGLKREGYDPYYKRVDTKEEMELLLDNEKWDIVISDYSMPHFNGSEALELIKKKNLNIPFIVISGTIGEDVAVDMMKRGADDYIMKDNLKRLVASIEREMREAKNRESKIRAEHDLREAYNIINKSSSIAFLWRNEKECPVEFVTENVKKIFGYTADELINGKISYKKIIHPDDLKKVEREISECCRDEINSSFSHEPYRIITKKKEIKWIDDKKEIRRDSEGNITHFQGIIEDITEKKRAEEVLRESEKKYRELVENINDWVWITDQKGIYLYSSSKVNEILGLEAADIIGKSMFELIPENERKNFFNIFQNIVKNKISFYRIVVKNLDKTGCVKILEKSGNPFFDQNGNLIGYRGIDRDITEQKNLEHQLFQAQKMESIGLLAGGIAHDFNNLLMAIMSYSKFIEMKLEDDNPLKEYINEITNVCRKATTLTQNLLAFSRKQIMNLSSLKLNSLISEIKKTLIHLIREDIELKTILYNKEINVVADSNAINQVLLNLVTNACDSMPNGGYLEIKTDVVKIDKNFINSYGYGKPGNYALIQVSDTGIGIDKKVYEKIFDPFYTTKEIGKGTGLGLSVSYGIIKQHNGFISVYSEKGEGTTFKIYLPLAQTKSKKREGTKENLSVLRGDETILVVEDEKEIRKSLKIILEDIGYNVIVAVDGIEAIEKFKKNMGKINLIILDIIIPKLNGKDVYEKIKYIAPDLKFIFMSGYTAESIKNKDISNKDLNFISKPILPDKLLNKIREVLDK